ncbi:hypothetical protein ACQP2E_29345 [Actinoplanes sp. CA-015351]|uniref:hypothetical protein n=1 Tax=Actinoplanes sp. CA-015351 TaxID=3239897 RepID=UPI003D98DD79
MRTGILLRLGGPMPGSHEAVRAGVRLGFRPASAAYETLRARLGADLCGRAPGTPAARFLTGRHDAVGATVRTRVDVAARVGAGLRTVAAARLTRPRNARPRNTRPRNTRPRNTRPRNTGPRSTRPRNTGTCSAWTCSAWSRDTAGSACTRAAAHRGGPSRRCDTAVTAGRLFDVPVCFDPRPPSPGRPLTWPLSLARPLGNRTGLVHGGVDRGNTRSADPRHGSGLVDGRVDRRRTGPAGSAARAARAGVEVTRNRTRLVGARTPGSPVEATRNRTRLVHGGITARPETARDGTGLVHGGVDRSGAGLVPTETITSRTGRRGGPDTRLGSARIGYARTATGSDASLRGPGAGDLRRIAGRRNGSTGCAALTIDLPATVTGLRHGTRASARRTGPAPARARRQMSRRQVPLRHRSGRHLS